MKLRPPSPYKTTVFNTVQFRRYKQLECAAYLFYRKFSQAHKFFTAKKPFKKPNYASGADLVSR